MKCWKDGKLPLDEKSNLSIEVICGFDIEFRCHLRRSSLYVVYNIQNREEIFKMKNVRKMVYLGLFIALEIILTRFLSIQTPIVRIGFAFLPIALSGMMFGPIYSGIAAAIADVVGMMLFPTGGAYFVGFTITSFLSGAVYGIILYNKRKSILRISIAVIIVSVVLSLGLDTLWLSIITGQGYVALLPARIIKCAVMIPIQVPIIQIVWRYAVRQIYDDSALPEV